MRLTKLIRGCTVAAPAIAISIVATIPATAAAPADPPRPVPGDKVPAQVYEALQRDLGLSRPQADRVLADQARAIALESDLIPGLGRDYSGSWFDARSGKLQVAVTSPQGAAKVRQSGAQPHIVDHTRAGLEAVTDELTRLADADPGAVAGILEWGIDDEANTVLVTVSDGAEPAALAKLAEHGDAVTVERTGGTPATTAEWLHGGDAYNSCSAGFNAYSASTGLKYLITAGHCGDTGEDVFRNGKELGFFYRSVFDTRGDWALVRNTNAGEFVPGPSINGYDGGNVWQVRNYYTSPPPAGTAICKSGRTTRVTCGTVTVRSASTTVVGPRMDLTRHTACYKPGDSGGANFSWNSQHVYAEGISSGAILWGGRCGSEVGQETMSYFQAVGEVFDTYSWLRLQTAWPN